jgi:hypothetical protein
MFCTDPMLPQMASLPPPSNEANEAHILVALAVSDATFV